MEWNIDDSVKPRWHCGVRVPYSNGGCSAERGGWLCTRPGGHGGRHAAACPNGDVMAVWNG